MHSFCSPPDFRWLNRNHVLLIIVTLLFVITYKALCVRTEMSCLFCDADVREGTGKKKRKLIFGKKCEQVLSILDNLCLVHYLPYPVGRDTKTSLPDRKASIASFCFSLRVILKVLVTSVKALASMSIVMSS